MTAGLVRGLPEARRNEAAALFRARGIPHRRIEDWKYSDLRTALGEKGLGAATAQWKLSALPAGVELFDLSEDGAPDWVRTHLGSLTKSAVGAASLTGAAGGFALRVTAAVGESLSLQLSGEGQLRGLVVLEDGACLTLFEQGDDAALRNVGIEIVLAQNAALEHVRIAPKAPGAVQIEEIGLSLARDARYRAHFAGFGAKLSRVELAIALNGAGAEAHLSGVSVLGDGLHCDVTTHVTHAVGNTASTQLFKHVAGGKSRTVYQGKVTVSPGANGADSRQTAKALLLGTKAEADLKPELEIFADDVKCAHGAAVGDLDAESLFYLRARGIPEDEARSLLIHAFLEDAMTGISSETLRQGVRDAVNETLAGIGA